MSHNLPFARPEPKPARAPSQRVLTFLFGMNILGALLLGLYIPMLSFGCIPALFGLNHFLLRVPSRQFYRHRRPLGLLLGFCAVHFGLSAYYGFIHPLLGVLTTVSILLAYLTGILWGLGARQSRRGTAFFTLPLLALIAGFTLFATLTAHQSLRGLTALVNADRAAPSFWVGGDPINGPLLGILASSGICLLPLLLVRVRLVESGLNLPLLAVLVPALGACGLYANFIFQNRSPYLALALALGVTLLHFWRRAPYSRSLKLGLLARRAGPVAVGITLVGLALGPDLVGLAFARFNEVGLETERTSAWVATLEGLPHYPLGGRHISGVLDVAYSHNLWLDVGYTSGILAMLLLLAFHLLHLRAYLRLIREMQPLGAATLLLCLSASMFMACMGEPALDASPVYFATTCLVLALVRECGSGSLDAASESP